MAFDRKEYMRKWKAEHREELNEKARKYRAEHPDRVRATKKKYYENLKLRAKMNEAESKGQSPWDVVTDRAEMHDRNKQ